MDSILTEDKQVLSAASEGQTDFILQLLEEENGQERVHSYKDQVRHTVCLFVCLVDRAS